MKKEKNKASPKNLYGIVIKVIILILILVIWSGITKVLDPMITNDLAVNQLANDNSSYWGLELYLHFKEYSWLFMILFLWILFGKTIIRWGRTIIQKNRKEEDIQDEE